ncbi:MAG: ABC transporter ATP-binding protein [Chloroflexi bacterium CFX4]|nr:ABC transporter ATP-binding protein [Chloroflexi bacterium CFX4]MDL1923189.1 ABC transporter ATP-binding protein [Chloroflexi bacterium CFX3]
MGDIALRVEGLGKQYRIGKAEAAYRTFRDVLADTLSAPFRRAVGLLRGNAAAANNLSEVIWALRDVSFTVKKGEVVGIIGRNGAGKSTLLKILSSITEPTTGEAKLYGRVGALLEVGTGFHPELTGRENIYLNGAILGMSRAEIRRKFDEIVAFAEVEKFIDTPVKHYSSGMGLRLGFAVAAHLEPEILIVDEVLAVGDSAFQRKCLGKMGEVAGEGRTVLFVSHNMAAVQNLCGRGIVLESGRLIVDALVNIAIEAYTLQGSLPSQAEIDLHQHPNRVSKGTPILARARLMNAEGILKNAFITGDTLILEFHINTVQLLKRPIIGIGFADSSGTRIFNLVSAYTKTGSSVPDLQGNCAICCRIDQLPLLPGRYSVSVSAGSQAEPLQDAIEDAFFLDVEAGDFFKTGNLPSVNWGKVLVQSEWESYEWERRSV